MVPWGLGLGKPRELFRPCRASERCPAPYFLSAPLARSIRCERASIKNASGGPKPAAFSLKKTAYLHFLAVASHVICAFSQADLLVGALSAAKAGAAKATARPRVMMETSVFIGGFSLHAWTLPHGRSRQGYLRLPYVSVRQNDWEPAALFLASSSRKGLAIRLLRPLLRHLLHARRVRLWH